MPDQDDIVNHIDAITSTDAMRSRPNPDTDGPTPAPLALVLGVKGPQIIRLNRDNPAGHVADLVGDPGVDRYRLGVVDVWVGDNSRARAEVNPGAEFVIEGVLRAIIAGNLAAPDRVRDHAARLIDTQQTPVIHGPAVMTGPTGDDGIPTALPGNVARWFDRFVARVVAIAEARAALNALVEGRAEVTYIVLDND